MAGAVALLGVLAVWGLLSLLVGGETTATTWALGLGVMYPVSALSVAGTDTEPGRQYAVGLAAGVVVLSVAYLGVGVVDYTLVESLAGFDPLELVAVSVVAALLGGGLGLVDVTCVERPVTAAALEERYVDDPVDGD